MWEEGCKQDSPHSSQSVFSFIKDVALKWIVVIGWQELAETKQPKMMRTWFFPKGQEPIDLVAKAPQPDLLLGNHRLFAQKFA